MNLSSVVNNPTLAEPFSVQRSIGGAFGPSGWTEKYSTLNYYGIISIADAKTVDAVPEADRVHEMIVINCELPLYVTRVANEGTPGQGTSDVVTWQGDQYRILKVHNYSNRGYYWCLAARMVGA